MRPIFEFCGRSFLGTHQDSKCGRGCGLSLKFYERSVFVELPKVQSLAAVTAIFIQLNTAVDNLLRIYHNSNSKRGFSCDHILDCDFCARAFVQTCCDQPICFRIYLNSRFNHGCGQPLEFDNSASDNTL